MYTPLKLMNQIEDMVDVKGQSKLKARANDSMVKFSELFWSRDRAEKFVKSKVEWNRIHNVPLNIFPDYSRDIIKYMNSYTQNTGLVQFNAEDFLFQNQFYLIRNDWSRNKKVYKIDNDMMLQLCSMKIPDKVPLKALVYLPSKCFYIDYNGLCPFCKEAVGAFVTYDIYDNNVLWSIANVIEGDRVQCIYTDMAIKISKDDTIDDVTCSSMLLGFSEEPVTMKLEQGIKITITDRDCIKFFINFCLYLFSVNNDVEYTERTRSIYKRKNTISNTMKEVEEFGVGFKYGQRISVSNTKIKYIGNKPAHVGPKRPYSSNYRSAHWHRYWINDDKNPGEKKLIIKWLEGTFVHGNRDDDSVKVSRVTK